MPANLEASTASSPHHRVVCLGASITVGIGTNIPAFDSFPAQLARMLGDTWSVENFGVSGATLLMHGDKPYRKEQAFQKSLESHADTVIINLGGNDSKPLNWKFKAEFVGDYLDLIAKIKSRPNPPLIYVCLPAYVSGSGNYGINEPVVREIIPMIEDIATKSGAHVIDMHTPLVGKDNLYGDRVHPNTEAACLMAHAAFTALTGEDFKGAIPSVLKSEWQGYQRLDFVVDGRMAVLVLPKAPADGRPWIWRTEFFGAFPQADVALLGKGFFVAYIDVHDMYGAPMALDHMDKFYECLLRDHRLSARTVLEGFSRGGLFALNWAARNPREVACLYIDAPVCDFKSWPGCFGRTVANSPNDWEQLKKVYGFKSDEEARAYRLNPIDNLKPLADARIPILSVCGGADTAAIFEENTGIVQERYKKLGGEIQVIVKPGVGHHPHSLEDPKPIVDFILRHR